MKQMVVTKDDSQEPESVSSTGTESNGDIDVNVATGSFQMGKSNEAMLGKHPSSCLDEKLFYKLISTDHCKIVHHGKGEITVLQMKYPSTAFDMYQEHYLPGGVEPDELDASDPSFTAVPQFAGPLVVPLSVLGNVMQEVWNALVAFSPLRKSAFNGNAQPEIRLGPLVVPPLGVRFHHTTIAAYKVLERIEVGYGLPTIAALPRGTIITQLNIVYSNCAVSLELVKR